MIGANIWNEAQAAIVCNTVSALKARGCALTSFAGNVYTITLDQGIAEADCIVDITIRGSTGVSALIPVVEHISDTVKEIRLYYNSGGGEQPARFTAAFSKMLP